MERKGYESIGCYTYFVTLSYDLDLGFSRLNFENAVSHEGEGRYTWNRFKHIHFTTIGSQLYNYYPLLWGDSSIHASQYHEYKQYGIDWHLYRLSER